MGHYPESGSDLLPVRDQGSGRLYPDLCDLPKIHEQHPALPSKCGLERLRVKLLRAMLVDWIIRCGIDYMEPVYEWLHMLQRDIIHANKIIYRKLSIGWEVPDIEQ